MGLAVPLWAARLAVRLARAMITKDFPSVKEKHRIRCGIFVIMWTGRRPGPVASR
jgi:hypothetical protein